MMRGSIALAEGAITAGCRYYFGYPITPQNEISEHLSARLPEVGGVFIQAESEIASINMLLGAAAAGARAMTSSSGPGISLMQEGLSYMSGSELPALIVNITRLGPGLGGIAACQGDYWQATRGGGHGDYRVIVLAPNSVQEMYSLTIKAFHLADKYRNPAMILADAILGQMKEPVSLSPPEVEIGNPSVLNPCTLATGRWRSITGTCRKNTGVCRRRMSWWRWIWRSIWISCWSPSAPAPAW